LPGSLKSNANILVMAATILLVGAVGLLTWMQFTNGSQAQFLVRHTNEVITAVDELRIAVRSAETDQRGYLLTGREDYLTPYRDAIGRAIQLQGQLLPLTANNPNQQNRLRALAPLLQRKLEQLAQTIPLRSENGLGAALAIEQTDLGRRLMGEIDATLTDMRSEEERLLDERRRKSDRAETDARLLALGGSGLAVGLLLLGARLLTRSRRQLTASEAEQRAMAGQMSAAFDSVSQGIGAFDADGRLVRWNARFPRLLGLPDAMMHPGTAYEALAEWLAAGGSPSSRPSDRSAVAATVRRPASRWSTSAPGPAMVAASNSVVPPCPAADSF
jgi:CHASE3 domain sensor protein